jgi:hypothetical protein
VLSRRSAGFSTEAGESAYALLIQKRYYYYAHLRKDFPYRKDLAVGSNRSRRDVIGYLGRTATRQGKRNNIRVAHMHFRMQLVFDEIPKGMLSEIWIDVYQIVRLLNTYRSLS